MLKIRMDPNYIKTTNINSCIISHMNNNYQFLIIIVAFFLGVINTIYKHCCAKVIL